VAHPYPAQQPPQPWRPYAVKRIPTDQPFVVGPSAGKRALLLGGALLFVLLLVGCPLGLAVGTSNSGGDAVFGVVAVLGCLAVFLGALLGVQLWMLSSGGPVLAVGPAGLWIKTRPTRGQAVWLPWEAVARIYRRRWAFDKVVCVQPRDPRAGDHLGAYTAVDASMQKLVFGTGFTAPLTFANRPESEIMGALAHYAAGRVRVE
jgi:hypothetical protein